MNEQFIEMLKEPANTLGRTEEAVAIVLADPARIVELYECYFQPDEWVRLRASSAFKRLWKADVELVLPFLDGFVDDVSAIDQPSVQWTFALMCLDLDNHLTNDQRTTCKARLKSYLENSDDWIVQNNTITTLGTWAKEDTALREWLLPRLKELSESYRKSVARRAIKWLEELTRGQAP